MNIVIPQVKSNSSWDMTKTLIIEEKLLEDYNHRQLSVTVGDSTIVIYACDLVRAANSLLKDDI